MSHANMLEDTAYENSTMDNPGSAYEHSTMIGDSTVIGGVSQDGPDLEFTIPRNS